MNTHRTRDQPVIDLDSIAVALGSPDSHDHPRAYMDLAGAARSILIRKAIDKDIDVWVIDTFLRSKLLTEHSHRCEYTLIDPGHTITLNRATEAGRPAASITAIERWYKNPPTPPHPPTPTPTPDTTTAVTNWW